MHQPWSNLARIVYRRTYSRKDSGTLENWDQTIERVVMGNVRGHNVPEEEIKALLRLGRERKAIPAGRGLWFSGSPQHARIGETATCNCWGLTADNWEHYVTAQNLLMLGGGVGMSVEHRFVTQLPRIKRDVVIEHRHTKDADFIVPDSREGWCELLRRVLESYFVTGRSFTYSTIVVRGHGEPIAGFGGVASGPQYLVRLVNDIRNILIPRTGKHVRPIDAGDLLCAIGDMVVAGNVRRSALILIGDPWDKEFLKAKRWDLEQIPSYRSRANYSVVCSDVEDLHPLFWKTYEHGEPFGIVNRKNVQRYGRIGEEKHDNAVVMNPCQPSWATVLTPQGIRTIGTVSVGDVIWSGSNWTKITAKWSTGSKRVYEYKTSAGRFYGTENHRVVGAGKKIEVDAADVIDTTSGPKHPHSAVDRQAIVDGLVLGDGTFHKASNRAFLNVGINDQDYEADAEIREFIGPKSKSGKYHYEVRTTLIQDDLLPLPVRVVPDKYYYADSTKVFGFLRGLFSANGSVVANRVTLKATSLRLVEQVQDMLSSVGIRSYITTNKPSKVKFENGTYTCKQSYDLNISGDARQFYENIGFIQNYKTAKLLKVVSTKRRPRTSFEVKSKRYIRTEEVFDLTVEDPAHTYWTGGLLVSNCSEAQLENKEPCCLQEIALMNLKDEAEFVEAARLMHRYGKRITLGEYKDPEINKVVRKNRRVGTGITGCLGSPLFNTKSLDVAYQAIQKENAEYSKELGIPESIRTTVVKPSGTVSKVLDQKGYEGIHPAYSRFMIQRIRFASDDPLIPVLKAAGHHIEPEKRFDGSLNWETLVVDFYQQAPDGMPVADEDWDTWKQLDVLQMAQRHWADQAVSVTVYYKKADIPKLKLWLAENIKNLKTISFLCHDDHGFDQAPKEAITRDEFERLSARVKPIDLDVIGEGELESLECGGGSCPIK